MIEPPLFFLIWQQHVLSIRASTAAIEPTNGKKKQTLYAKDDDDDDKEVKNPQPCCRSNSRL